MKKVLQSVVWKEGKHYVARALNVEVSSFGASRREALMLYFEDTFASRVVHVEHPGAVTL